MEQRYLLTYPETNSKWYSAVPDKCTFERKKECCERMNYRPKPANNCSSTFMPWDRPTPNQCLKACKGLDGFNIPACSYEKLKYPRIINNNGCLIDRSIWEYTNAPLNDLKALPGCNSKSVLTNPKRNAPPPSQYGYKYSDIYDPILYTYGQAYTF